jgi:MFS transporter, DHA3 family, macrolide efflux protein
VRPSRTAPTVSAGVRLLAEVAFGWRYIRERPGLVALLAFFFATNFTVLRMFQILVTPLVLGFAGPAALGSVLAAGGIGALVGSVAMSVWGGPDRRVRVVLAFTVVQALLVMVGGLGRSVPLIGAALFGVLFCFPFVGAPGR